MLAHLESANIELAGLLIGNVISYKNLITGLIAINIEKIIPAEDFHASPVSLSMNSSVWNKTKGQVNDNSFVVGWYHSHPNLGAFFSGTDRNTQKNFFNNKYNVGLVVDPVRKEEKWYIGKDSDEVSRNKILIHKDEIFSTKTSH